MRPTAASDTLQQGWWWDDNEDYGVRRSVGYILSQLDSYNSHNSVYVLNVSPNPAGRVEEAAVKRLKEVAAKWEKPADLTEPGDNWGFQYDVSRNLAFMCPASQSSIHPFIRDKRAYPRAEIAVDGVLEGNGEMEQTSITNVEERPWWQVDLTRECRIDRISVHQRTDVDHEERRGYRSMILNAQGEVGWEQDKESTDEASFTINTDGVNGQILKIVLDGEGALALAEVLVEGSGL